MTIDEKLNEIEETRTDETASNETTVYTHQLEWLIEQAKKVEKYEKIIKTLEEENSHMEDWMGEDGHNARVILSIIGLFKS